MKGRRCINPLLFLFALSQYQAWIVMTDFVGFQPLGALDGHTCPAEYADTSKNAFNRTKCFLYCATKSSCRGVFFEQETLRCIKCAAQFFQLNDTHSSLSKFYKVKDGVFAYKLVEKRMSWDEAKQNCFNLGGQLSTIKSLEEQTFVANFVNTTYQRGVWIGGNGTAGDENSFKWLDGTTVSSGYANWYTIYKKSGSNCMKMSKNANYKWKNVNCMDLNFSVCKIE